MAQSLTPHPRPPVLVGNLFPQLAVLSSAAVILAIGLLAFGDASYAAAAGAVFLLLALLATSDSLLARHQARSGAGDSGGNGTAAVFAVELGDPLSVEGDSPPEIGPHDVPPGHPMHQALKEAQDGSAPETDRRRAP